MLMLHPGDSLAALPVLLVPSTPYLKGRVYWLVPMQQAHKNL